MHLGGVAGPGGLLLSAWALMTSRLTYGLGLMAFPLLGLLSSPHGPASRNPFPTIWKFYSYFKSAGG